MFFSYKIRNKHTKTAYLSNFLRFLHYFADNNNPKKGKRKAKRGFAAYHWNAALQRYPRADFFMHKRTKKRTKNTSKFQTKLPLFWQKQDNHNKINVIYPIKPRFYR